MRALFNVMVLTIFLATFLTTPGTTWAEGEAASNPFVSLAAKAPSLVTVRFVLETRMGAAVREAEGEIDCLVIDDNGLVLCAHLNMGGQMAIMSQLYQRGGDTASSQAREIRVFPGDDTAGVEAELIAQDSDRGLVWLQASEPLGDEIGSVDFAAGAEPEPGDEVFMLRRLDKFFGKAPMVVSARIGAVIDQPRVLWVPTPEISGNPGMPVFMADGRPVGVLTVQFPGTEDGALKGAGGIPGQRSKLQDMIGGVILPAADIVRATRLAREIHAADREERLE